VEDDPKVGEDGRVADAGKEDEEEGAVAEAVTSHLGLFSCFRRHQNSILRSTSIIIINRNSMLARF
jgi:hypothetical protein